MSKRINKVNQLIRETLAQIIREELSLKNTIIVTILKVDTSKDLRYANTFLSVYPANEKDYVLKTLKRESGKIHKALHQKLFMKPLPKVNFRVDNNQEKIAEIEEIFDKINNE
ncbi:MAG: 30S ribosome-binding factor RbfA [Candidatus Moranbacteria bacterium]|nr:30S ribosome-binding factor RbfA [Candidatus Moranbacteria bacterium]